MRLKLDRDDLLPEHHDIGCSLTKYEHFKPQVQQAIRIVGRATFHGFGTYNEIYPSENDPRQWAEPEWIPFST